MKKKNLHNTLNKMINEKNTEECEYYDWHGCKKLKRDDIVCDHDSCKYYKPIKKKK
jgi:hypothetical protein